MKLDTGKLLLAAAALAVLAGSPANAAPMNSPTGIGMNIFSIALGTSDGTSSLTDTPGWSFSSMSTEAVWDTYDPNGNGNWADVFGFRSSGQAGSGIGEPGNQIAAAPEPTALALAGLGLLALGFARRRSR
jgi:hypothetical protein